jgi:hypothetical protein
MKFMFALNVRRTLAAIALASVVFGMGVIWFTPYQRNPNYHDHAIDLIGVALLLLWLLASMYAKMLMFNLGSSFYEDAQSVYLSAISLLAWVPTFFVIPFAEKQHHLPPTPTSVMDYIGICAFIFPTVIVDVYNLCYGLWGRIGPFGRFFPKTSPAETK